ncbi:MAG: hypothetical protein M3P26_03065 [Gemmatimonadota bacterium]|nr:hypothetical protein [Gemmatimonadota bacterium]
MTNETAGERDATSGVHEKEDRVLSPPVGRDQKGTGEFYISILKRDFFGAIRICSCRRGTPQSKLAIGIAVLEFPPDGIAFQFAVEGGCREVSRNLEMHGWWAIGDLGDRDPNDP